MKLSNSKFILGGAAFLNGVLIKSPHFLVVAKRTSEKKISVSSQKLENITVQYKILSFPFIRGLALLLDIIRLLVVSRKYRKVFKEGKEKLKFKKNFSQKIDSCWFILIAFTILFFIFLKIQDFVGNLEFILGQEGIIIVSEILFYFIILSISLIFIRFRRQGIILQYHGAEHKSINAYESGAKLSAKKVSEFSRIHLRCGTTLLWFIMIVDVFLLSFLTYLPILPQGLFLNLILIIVLYFLLFSISFEIMMLVIKYSYFWLGKILLWPALQLQKASTKEPSLEQVEVALCALKEVLKKEKGYKRRKK